MNEVIRAEGLVKHYSETLKLNTMTDYQSPGGFGTVWYNTGVTWLVISVTNVSAVGSGRPFVTLPDAVVTLAGAAMTLG